MNLKLFINPIIITSVVVVAATQPHLHLPEFLGCQTKRELVAAPLVLEAIDAPQGLCDGDIEDEVCGGEKSDGDPAMAALETW